MANFKLIVDVGVYGISDKTYCFVKKIDEVNFQALHGPASCKDYTHETIASFIHGVEVGYPLFRNDKEGFVEDFSKLQLVMFFKLNNDEDVAKKRLFSVKKYLSAIEKECGIKQTLITEIDIIHKNKPGVRAFLLTFDKVYVESPALLHGFMAFMRTLSNVGVEVNKKNIEKVLAETTLNDHTILKFILKHDVFRLIMSKHKDIVEGLTLKDIYPIQVTNIGSKMTSYHSGFGMVALCTHRLASKAYSDKILKVLEENKIPKYA